MDEQKDITGMTVDIVSAFVGSNSLSATELPTLIANVHRTLSGLITVEEPKPAQLQTPAVPVKKSIGTDFITCLEDGRKFKSLKRHLRTKYDMSPEDYRTKWGLPKDYPMVAPAYAATRSALAKQAGLGQGGRKTAINRRGRKPSS